MIPSVNAREIQTSQLDLVKSGKREISRSTLESIEKTHTIGRGLKLVCNIAERDKVDRHYREVGCRRAYIVANESLLCTRIVRVLRIQDIVRLAHRHRYALMLLVPSTTSPRRDVYAAAGSTPLSRCFSKHTRMHARTSGCVCQRASHDALLLWN